MSEESHVAGIAADATFKPVNRLLHNREDQRFCCEWLRHQGTAETPPDVSTAVIINYSQSRLCLVIFVA
jgi:hypothetical protein